jgi:hypothetical protein
MAYSDPSYSYGKLVAREGMMPVYSGSLRDGNLTTSWEDDPNYQKSPQLIDFQKKIASGQIQKSSSYGKSHRGEGPDFSEGSRQSAYTSYDPSTNMVTFYDPEGNVTQQGQKSSAGGGPGFASGALGAVGGVANAVGTVASNPQALTAIALAVAIPGIGAAIGESLMAAGVVSSAAAATTLGTAIASTAAQVAQGVPVEKAITNTLVNVGVSQVSPVVAQEINSVIGHPAVSDAITSAAASGVKTSAAGGSSEDITTAMTAGLAGSAANSAYSSAANDYNSTTGKVLGSATAGAVTGGAAGALNNALTTAASSIGTPKPLGDTSTKPVAAVDGGGGDAELPPGQADSSGGAAPTPAPSINATVNIPPSPVAGLDITQNESAAETARLAAKEQQILDLITPAPVAEEPKQGAFLPDTAPSSAEIDTSIPRVEVSGVGTIPIESTPVTGLDITENQSQAETDRLARQEAKVADAADVPAVEVAPSTGTGLIDTPPVSDTDKQILDLISETPTEDQSDAETERLARKEAELAGAEKGAYLPDSGTDTKTTTYKPNLFTTTYLSPKTRTAAAPASALGSALGTTGLTSYRGAGEIEGTGSGKPRKKVWNEESLKLKDALGV